MNQSTLPRKLKGTLSIFRIVYRFCQYLPIPLAPLPTLCFGLATDSAALLDIELSGVVIRLSIRSFIWLLVQQWPATSIFDNTGHNKQLPLVSDSYKRRIHVRYFKLGSVFLIHPSYQIDNITKRENRKDDSSGLAQELGKQRLDRRCHVLPQNWECPGSEYRD